MRPAPRGDLSSSILLGCNIFHRIKLASFAIPIRLLGPCSPYCPFRLCHGACKRKGTNNPRRSMRTPRRRASPCARFDSIARACAGVSVRRLRRTAPCTPGRAGGPGPAQPARLQRIGSTATAARSRALMAAACARRGGRGRAGHSPQRAPSPARSGAASPRRRVKSVPALTAGLSSVHWTLLSA